MKKYHSLCGVSASVLATALMAAPAAQAQEPGPVVDQIIVSQKISSPAGDPAANLAAYLLGEGENPIAVGTLVQTSEMRGRAGERYLEFEQVVNGLRVLGSGVTTKVSLEGRLERVSNRTTLLSFVRGVDAVPADQALQAALAMTHGDAAPLPALDGKDGNVSFFADDEFFFEAPKAEKVMLRVNGALEEGWLVTTWSNRTNMLYETQVDARGNVVDVMLRTANDSYNVYPDHPGITPQVVVQGPGAGNTESPIGWLWDGSGSGEPDVTQYSTFIQGNNVRAYLDRDNDSNPNDDPTTTSANEVTSDNFVTNANLSQSPLTLINQEAAVQNLFWLNNVIHDELYRHGFDESSRNFQSNNFGNGGFGNDPVWAEAQDGGGTNNANFSTPSDGSRGRMQMYLWTNPTRDGDFDSDIIWHEYGHGLTWRIIGNMSGSDGGAIGEGMSDVLAIVMNDQPTVGEYATNNFSRAIRSQPYDNHLDTLESYNSGRGVHRNGEIYAAALWQVRTRYYDAGFDRDDLMGDIIQGLKDTDAIVGFSAPDYLEMRDGLIDAATDFGRQCLVWDAFASKGMGEGATFNTSFQSNSFDIPAECSAPSEVTVEALTGSQTEDGNRWAAIATIDTDVINATVVGRWATDTDSKECVTDGAGICSIQARFRSNSTSNTFTLETVADLVPMYADGVSDTLVVQRGDAPPPPPPPPPPPGGDAVEAISSSQVEDGNRWAATITVDTNVAGATLVGKWSTDPSSKECVTDTDGICSIQARFRTNSTSNTFVIETLDGEVPAYLNGTSDTLVVQRGVAPPPPPPPANETVEAMSGGGVTDGNRWAATVTIDTDTPNAVVVGKWTTDSGSKECTTDAAGICTIQSRFRTSVTSNTFTLETVNGEVPDYAPGVSDTITVDRS